MKMQDVIRRMRELVPAAFANADAAQCKVAELKLSALDMGHVTSADARLALARLVAAQATDAEECMFKCYSAMKELDELNAAYKEKLGPRGKKPGDDPRQMELDLSAGRSTCDGAGTSDTSRKCPRCKASALGCEFNDGGVCKGVVYPTNPPQYDPCVFGSRTEARQ